MTMWSHHNIPPVKAILFGQNETQPKRARYIRSPNVDAFILTP
jgi:hypothetical protein